MEMLPLEKAIVLFVRPKSFSGKELADWCIFLSCTTPRDLCNCRKFFTSSGRFLSHETFVETTVEFSTKIPRKKNEDISTPVMIDVKMKLFLSSFKIFYYNTLLSTKKSLFILSLFFFCCFPAILLFSCLVALLLVFLPCLFLLLFLLPDRWLTNFTFSWII